MEIQIGLDKALEILGHGKIRTITKEELTYKSQAFGTPIFMPITFEELRYYDKALEKEIVTPECFVPCAIVEIDFNKNIVKTTVKNQYRKGTFKEFIALDDYKINIRGILCADDNLFPMDKIKWLHDICTATNEDLSVGIIHDILNEIGVYNVVIESGRFLPKKGFENIMPFELECISDYKVQHILNEMDEQGRYKIDE